MILPITDPWMLTMLLMKEKFLVFMGAKTKKFTVMISKQIAFLMASYWVK